MTERDDRDDYINRMDDHTAFTTQQGQPINKVAGVDWDRTAEEMQQQHLDSKMAHAEHNPLQEREETHEYDPDVRTAATNTIVVSSFLSPEFFSAAMVAQASNDRGNSNAREGDAQERVDVKTAERFNRQPPEYVAEQLNDTREEYTQQRGELPAPSTPSRGVDRNAGMAVA